MDHLSFTPAVLVTGRGATSGPVDAALADLAAVPTMAGHQRRVSAAPSVCPTKPMLLGIALANAVLFTLAYNFSPPSTTWTTTKQQSKRADSIPPPEPFTANRVGARPAGARTDSENTLCVFSGRWEVLRINFPYIYRGLRRNGGVLDRVHYYMMRYDAQTLAKLTELTESANVALGQDVFRLRFRNPGEDSTRVGRDAFGDFLYEIFDEMVRHPERKYFKMDDDIVYIHPGTFRQFIEQQNASECFVHFANIGGANWRISYIHQEMGIYDNEAVNPKKLRFQFDRRGLPKCGWKSAQCAAVGLRAFFYHHQNKSLDKFLFDGRYMMWDRARHSINFYMLDSSLIDVEAMTKSGPIAGDDEHWLTEVYSRKVKNPNCVVGKAFVVHFSYFVTRKELDKYDFLRRFAAIADDLAKELPESLQAVLAPNGTLAALTLTPKTRQQ